MKFWFPRHAEVTPPWLLPGAGNMTTRKLHTHYSARKPHRTLWGLWASQISLDGGLGHVLVRILPVYCLRHEKFAGTEALGAEGIYCCIHSRGSEGTRSARFGRIFGWSTRLWRNPYTHGLIYVPDVPIVSHSIPERPLGPPNRVGKYITTKSAIFWESWPLSLYSSQSG